MNPKQKRILIRISIILLFITGLVIWNSYREVDHQVTKGTIWGFSIGTSRAQVFNVAKTHVSQKKARWLRSPYRADKEYEHTTEFAEDDFEKFQQLDSWVLIISYTPYSEWIQLTFNKDTLIKIWHRRVSNWFPY